MYIYIYANTWAYRCICKVVYLSNYGDVYVYMPIRTYLCMRKYVHVFVNLTLARTPTCPPCHQSTLIYDAYMNIYVHMCRNMVKHVLLKPLQHAKLQAFEACTRWNKRNKGFKSYPDIEALKLESLIVWMFECLKCLEFEMFECVSLFITASNK